MTNIDSTVLRVAGGGVLFLGSGCISYLVRRSRLENSVRVSAIVERISHDRDQSYCVTMKYVTTDGKERHSIARASATAPIGLGSIVDIAYEPENPDDIILVDEQISGRVPIWLAIAGVLLIGVACLMYFNR